MRDIAAIVVTYNSEEVIGDCLNALSEIHVVVVDNASQDRTVETVLRCPSVQLIRNTENMGFAAAVNQGVAATDAHFLLIVNPDTVVVTGITELVDTCRETGLAAGKLSNREGKAQVGFTIRRFPTPLTLAFEVMGVNRLWPSNPVNRRYRYLDRDLDTAGEVEQPAGAFLMFRRDVWQVLGGFDHRFYPIWFEDVDFCERAHLAGFRIGYVPSAVARHRGAHSISRMSARCRVLCWYVSLLKYAAKRFRPFAYRCICTAVAVACVGRMVWGMVRERSLVPAQIYSKIIRLAGLSLFSRDVDGSSLIHLARCR